MFFPALQDSTKNLSGRAEHIIHIDRKNFSFFINDGITNFEFVKFSFSHIEYDFSCKKFNVAKVQFIGESQVPYLLETLPCKSPR